MNKYFTPALLRDSFQKALNGEIQCGLNAPNLPLGVVEISAFKFDYAVLIEPNELLPTPPEMMNIHMWDHLKNKLPKVVASELESTTQDLVQSLVADGVITIGGIVKDSRGTMEFNGPDWAVSTLSQR